MKQAAFDFALPPAWARRPVNATIQAPAQPRSLSSTAGSRAIQPRAGTLRAEVLRLIIESGPVSADGSGGGRIIGELTEALTLLRGRRVQEGTVCGRLHELRKLGLVCDSGRRRRGPSGVACTVWVALTTAEGGAKEGGDGR
jgi:hypothetical protein